MILAITLSNQAGEIAEGNGSPLEAVLILRELVKAWGKEDLHLSWPIGAGTGGLMIPAGQSFDDAILGAHAELQDPDLVFDDPAEEDMARLIVRNLYLAVLLDTTDLVVEQIEERERAEAGDHSEDAGYRYDRYDELEGGESYN